MHWGSKKENTLSRSSGRTQTKWHSHSCSSDSSIHLTWIFWRRRKNWHAAPSRQSRGTRVRLSAKQHWATVLSCNHYAQQNNNNLQMALCQQTAGTQTSSWGLISAWLCVTLTSGGEDRGSCIYSALRQIVIRGGKHSLKPKRAHWCHSRVFVRSDQGTEWSWGFN